MENEIDLHDMHMEEQLWPTLHDEGDADGDDHADEDGQADAEADDAEEYGDDEGFQPDDLSDDADALESAGMGTDEDYGDFGGGDDY